MFKIMFCHAVNSHFEQKLLDARSGSGTYFRTPDRQAARGPGSSRSRQLEARQKDGSTKKMFTCIDSSAKEDLCLIPPVIAPR